MKAYILSVCGAVIVSALVVMLLPEGKTGKFINGILKLFCLLVMLIPLFGFLSDHGEPVFSGDDSASIKPDDDFIDYFFGERAEREEVYLKQTLEEEFEVTLTAEIAWNVVDYAYEVSNVTIEIENFGMNENDEHIFIINGIGERVVKLMRIPSEAVEVYEREG